VMALISLPVPIAIHRLTRLLPVSTQP
jgi:hypothetical protein